MDINKMTVEEFFAMKQKMDEAENDTTPYAVMNSDGDELNVIGDVNKTEVKKHDYTILFYYPNTEAWKETLKNRTDLSILRYTDNYIICRRVFKDIWVPPRVYTAVQTAFVELYQFFNTVSEDGELRDLTYDEAVKALRMLDQEMIEAMVHAVATVLQIPREEEDFIYSLGLPTVVIQMVGDFPEIINGVDFFTDNLSENEDNNGLTVL